MTDEGLVTAYRTGDDAALTELLDRYRPLIRARSRRYYLQGAERQDVAQEGMIGLYKAVRDFDPDRSGSFAAFAERCVTRQILTAIQGARRYKHLPLNGSVSFEALTHPDGQHDSDAGDVLDSPSLADHTDPASRMMAAAELDDLRRWCLAMLSDLERLVLEQFLNGDSYAEIGETIGQGAKTVDNALQRIRRKLENHLATTAVAA